jgi:hypothetical protein
MMIASIVRRRIHSLGAAVLVALALGGCRSSTSADEAVEITTDRREYRAGDVVSVTVTNVSAEPIGYNLCVHRVERRTGTGWSVASEFPPPGSACIDALFSLAPGASVVVQPRLPQDLTAGVYRVRFESPALTTPTFRVEPGVVLH